MKLKVTSVEQAVRPIFAVMERYTVGVGQLGIRKTQKMVREGFRVRRVVQARSRYGICSYWFYRGEDKGKQCFNIQLFMPVKEITREQFAKVKLGL